MKKIIFLLSFFSLQTANADLLERLRLEETLQSRLQNTFKMYDDSAKIIVRLEYATFNGILPGTNALDGQVISPEKIELNDISKALIDVYSSLDEVPQAAKDAVLNAIPVADKKKVSLNFSKIDPRYMKVSKSVEAKDLIDVADKATSSFAKTIYLVFAISFGALFLVSSYQNSKRQKDFKEQFKLLANALVENGGGGSRAVNIPQQQLAPRETPKLLPHSAKDDTILETFSFASLKELFSDAYWCETDAYAHWLWKHLNTEQKRELTSKIHFLKDYSLYFVDMSPENLNFHEHPYYMEPRAFAGISQEDLSDLVRKNMSLWHQISPMRKNKLPLSLDEKLRATSASISTQAISVDAIQSKPRVFAIKPTWGQITVADELEIYSNPDMVPSQLRCHVRSLVWLAQKEGEYVKSVLTRFDARTLAEAWVGPEEILKTLEGHLPEKKLKLLIAYKDKVNSTRQSDVYQYLVDEGLKNEVA